MNLTKTFKDNVIVINYELDNREIEILKTVKKIGYLEFRTSYTHEDITASYTDIRISETIDLYINAFLEHDFYDWHTTYVLTDIAIQYLESLKKEFQIHK